MMKFFAGLMIIFWCACVFGYIANVVKLAKLDFDRPYKAEIIRGIGLLPPVGAVTGYLNINDK